MACLPNLVSLHSSARIMAQYCCPFGDIMTCWCVWYVIAVAEIFTQASTKHSKYYEPNHSSITPSAVCANLALVIRRFPVTLGIVAVQFVVPTFSYYDSANLSIQIRSEKLSPSTFVT